MLSFIKNILLVALIVSGVVAVAYFSVIRPWIFRMGAADAEVSMSLPGDGLVTTSYSRHTQAIDINAPKEIVWSYLIQVGYRRAGWYNLDFINRLAAKDYFYENNKSADRVIPELQSVKAGDKIYIIPQMGYEVTEIKPNESLLLTAHDGEKYVSTWIFTIEETGKDKTRLLTRFTSEKGKGLLLRLINTLIVEPGGTGVQQPMMLRGIKRRAETDFEKMQNR